VPARAPRREGRRVRPAAHRRVPEPAQVLRRAGAGQEHEVHVQFQHPLERQRPEVQHLARPHARPGRVPGERGRVPHVVEAVGGQRGARGRAHVRDERGPSSRPVDASQNMSQDQRAGDVAAVTVQDDRVALVTTADRSASAQNSARVARRMLGYSRGDDVSNESDANTLGV